MKTACGPATAGVRAPGTVTGPEAGLGGIRRFPCRETHVTGRWRRLTLAGAMAVLGPACTGSTTGPHALDTLVAISVDGEPLPATVVDWPDHRLEFLADTVRFSGDRYAQRRVERFTGLIGVPEIRETGTDGSVRVQGPFITLEPSCDALFCVDIVLVRVGSRYRATWAPVEGVEVVVEYRPLADVAGAI